MCTALSLSNVGLFLWESQDFPCPEVLSSCRRMFQQGKRPSGLPVSENTSENRPVCCSRSGILFCSALILLQFAANPRAWGFPGFLPFNGTGLCWHRGCSWTGMALRFLGFSAGVTSILLCNSSVIGIFRCQVAEINIKV